METNVDISTSQEIAEELISGISVQTFVYATDIILSSLPIYNGMNGAKYDPEVKLYQ